MTRARILEAALGRFSSSDYSETSLKDIAGDVGIKAPSIYAHFSNKEELYSEVYERSIADHRAYFRELIQSTEPLEPLERLRRILFGVRDFYRARPELLELHLRTALTQNMARVSGMQEAFMSWDEELSATLRETYVAGQRSAAFIDLPPAAFTAHFLALMDGLFLQMAHYSTEQYDVHLADTWSVLARFIAAGSATNTPAANPTIATDPTATNPTATSPSMETTA